jgi:sugar lactone lactonase YvrE
MDVATSPSLQLAPELPESLDWLNLPQPLRLSALRGRVCALAFVNAGSSWSLQRLHDLARLQARHGERLQVLAVHVPRFDHERDSQRIVQRLARHEFAFPIANDADWTAWQQYGIEAWPTVVLIDGNGKIREDVVGHGLFHDLDAQVTRLVRELADVPAATEPVELRAQPRSASSLRYPTGLAVSGNYLYVADSGHHRVLECDLAGRILRQFGTGRADLLDGPAETAAFRRPHGLCLQHGALYVADSGNHAIRRIDLRNGEVLTLLGCGQPGPASPGLVSSPDTVTLDHPRAMAVAGDALLIATCGDNRIWQYDLGTRLLQVAAGSGELAVNDGIGEEAAFAEPVALAAVQQLVYVCDGAGSAIRSLNIRNRQVATLVGQDPWNHGRADGARSEALLQDPQAIALDPDAPMLWIADCGNDLLRTLRLGGGELGTYPLPRPLHGPSGLAIADGIVWIADTDAHAVLRLEARGGTLHHVPIGE